MFSWTNNSDPIIFFRSISLCIIYLANLQIICQSQQQNIIVIRNTISFCRAYQENGKMKNLLILIGCSMSNKGNCSCLYLQGLRVVRWLSHWVSQGKGAGPVRTVGVAS